MRFAVGARTAFCVGWAILVTLALAPAHAQAPSAALRAKSADADAIAARAQLGPLRIIVQHQASNGPGHRTLRTPNENLPLILSENRAAQESIVTSHFGPLAALSGRDRALRLMGVTPAFAINATAAEIEALANNPRVLNIAIDKVERPILIQSVPLIGMTNAYSNYNATGSGFAVAIIDSGVDKTHTFLANVILEACYSTTTETLGSGGSASTCPGGASSSTASGSGVNCNIAWSGCEHGSHVAGIAAGTNTQFQSGQPPSGVAKASGIIAIKAASEFTGSDCGSDPSPCIAFWDSDMQAALDHVYAIRNSLPPGYQGVASANLSIGGGDFSNNCNRTNSSFKTSIDNLLSANIATVIAAGNDSRTGQISFPACISSAIAVSASSKNDVIAAYTNINAQVAVFAPGGDFSNPVPGAAQNIILSSVPAGFSCGNFPGPNPSSGGSYCYFAGTSMATPHVAGAFAAIRSAVPNATVAQILSALESTGTPIKDTRAGGTITKPRIRVDLALQSLASSFGILQVSPTTNISSSGQQGGPFSPSSFNYTLTASVGTRNYAISGVPSWLDASSTSGTATTSGTTVSFTVNSSASGLSPATYNATITFTDTTGSTTALTITATLTVNVQSVLQVSPATDIASAGNQGGPFSPSSFQYQLTANSGTIGYSISGLPAWLDVSSTSGTVTTSPATVTFTVNSAANGLAAGGYSATISFANTTNGQGNQTRNAALTVNTVNVAPASQTWVSGGGNDNNDCSRATPCQTFAGAIAKTAAGGEIDCLDPGGFGGLTITKAIAIVCDSTQAGVLVSGSDGIVISAGASDIVSLIGVTLDGVGSGTNGIDFISGGTLHVRKVQIKNFINSGISFVPSAGATKLDVADSSISDNGNSSAVAGILLRPTGSGSVRVTVDRTVFKNNSTGIRIDTTAPGGAVKGILRDSLVANSTNSGVIAIAGASAATLLLDKSTVTGNANGLVVSGVNASLLAKSTIITANGNGLLLSPNGTLSSYNDNAVSGNTTDGSFTNFITPK